MNPKLVKEIANSEAVEHFCTVFGLDRAKLKQVALYDGAANLVYYAPGNPGKYLRISYRKDRNLQMIATELDFVSYLSDNGLSCASPIPALSGNLCESFTLSETPLVAALFTEAKGKFLYQTQFRMPKGVSLNDFWHKTGEYLGLLHSLSSKYVNDQAQRFTWLKRHEASLDIILSHPIEMYRPVLQTAINTLNQVPVSKVNYGLCHNDFNIGNFKVDNSEGIFQINGFDFDDCGYNYFMYDLACVWELNTGWAYNIEEKGKYRHFMDKCFQTVLEGYYKHHDPGFDCEKMLPTFLLGVHIENILEPLWELQYAGKKARLDKEMQYHYHCLEHHLEYLGLYDDVFDAERPFRM